MLTLTKAKPKKEEAKDIVPNIFKNYYQDGS